MTSVRADDNHFIAHPTNSTMAPPTQSALEMARKTEKPVPAKHLPATPESTKASKRKGSLLEGTPKKRPQPKTPKPYPANRLTPASSQPLEDTIPDFAYKSMYEATQRMTTAIRAEYSKSQQELSASRKRGVTKDARIAELEAENEELRLAKLKEEEDHETGIEILEATIRNRDAQVESLMAEMRGMVRILQGWSVI
ncbi:hypothetical protein NX059_007566 [Plenodomus lindquistii]|nr:hypothetical protein NX059_007566 [Plenodomus lindquistii]